MSLEHFCVCHDEEGTELRLLSPLSKTSLSCNDMLKAPFGKNLWTVRNLGFNPNYESVSSAAAAMAMAGTGGPSPSATAANNAAANAASGLSFAGTSTTSGTTKVDRVAATPDLGTIAVASERIVRLLNGESRAVAAEMWMEEKVLGLRCNTDLLAVILAKATHFFHIDTLHPLPELRTQWPNPNFNGLGALSPMMESGTCYFAVSQSLSDRKERGDIFLYDPWRAATLTVIDAHDEPVRCLEFAGNGTKFASCSTNGRKIRIWSCPDCVPLYELQRGASEAIIYSIGLNYDATVLSVTSNTGTLHLFQPSKNTRSVNKITTRTSPTMCFLSPDGQFLFVLYPPDATSKTAKLERYKLTHELKHELENEMMLAV